jgi:hypothetical protein
MLSGIDSPCVLNEVVVVVVVVVTAGMAYFLDLDIGRDLASRRATTFSMRRVMMDAIACGCSSGT